MVYLVSLNEEITEIELVRVAIIVLEKKEMFPHAVLFQLTPAIVIPDLMQTYRGLIQCCSASLLQPQVLLRLGELNSSRIFSLDIFL